jgi:pimeloyl-ACP methyl ester carboxylesterase
MAAFWKKGLGMGVGAGLLGATVVALRLRARPLPQPSLPDVISPSVFARRVQRTTRGQIVYHASGEGEPLVFLHDLFPGAASYEWSKVYPEFASSHRVLAPDWIGFGESERPHRALRAEDYAQSLQEFVRATCGGRRPLLVGSGLGAALACLASAQHPELASRLFLFHPAGTADWLAPWVPSPLRSAAWTTRGRHWIYERYMAKPAGIERWLAGRRSAGDPLVLSEAVSVYASFARQYGAEWAVARIMSGRFRLEALPEMDRLCVPTVVWWPMLAGEVPGGLGGRAPVRVDCLEEAGALAPLDRAAELSARLRTELFEPVRLAAG